MKIVRKNVFETNSSSTHVLTIHKSEDIDKKIPRNVENLKICEIDFYEHREFLTGELLKLRFLVELIALELSDEWAFCEKHSLDYKDLKDWNKIKDLFLGQNYFKWLNEVIKEECNTTLEYTKTSSYFPFISEGFAFEETYVPNGFFDKTRKNDEEYVKGLYKEIIFNDNIVISDKNEEW